MAPGVLLSMTDLMEMLYLTLIVSYLDNQTMLCLSFVSLQEVFCSICTSHLTLLPTPWDLTTQMPYSGISHALPNLVMLFHYLAFPKVTTFTCSFGAFDVNVSVFNMSFSGADVRGLCLVKAAEGADQHNQSILCKTSVIFSACLSILDLPDLINAPTVYPRGCRITVPGGLWRDVLLHCKDSLTSLLAPKQEKITQ